MEKEEREDTGPSSFRITQKTHSMRSCCQASCGVGKHTSSEEEKSNLKMIATFL